MQSHRPPALYSTSPHVLDPRLTLALCASHTPCSTARSVPRLSLVVSQVVSVDGTRATPRRGTHDGFARRRDNNTTSPLPARAQERTGTHAQHIHTHAHTAEPTPRRTHAPHMRITASQARRRIVHAPSSPHASPPRTCASGAHRARPAHLPPFRGGVSGREVPPNENFCFSAGLRMRKEHMSDSSTAITAPALSNSPQ